MVFVGTKEQPSLHTLRKPKKVLPKSAKPLFALLIIL